jgi:DNA-binding LacI/PurR family transcriptional regulator
MKNHPLMTGIYSSLIATILTYVYVEISNFDIFARKTPLWMLIVSFILIIAILTSYISYRLTDPKRVFIILSQFPKQPFFASLINDLIVYLANHGIQAVTMPPSTFLSVESEKNWLDGIVKSKNHFIGGIIIPLKTEEKDSKLLKFVSKFKNPVLFIDAPLPISKEEYPKNSAFIGYDNNKGGKLAALAMLHELEQIGVKKPRILVIASKLVTDRQKAFMSYLKEKKGIEAKCIDEGGYLREKAMKIFDHLLSTCKNGQCQYDGIFCTNDEMALGVQDVIHKSQNFPIEKTVLIGYDGIQEATKEIDLQVSVLKNSILQDTNRLAEASVLKLICMIKKQEVETIELIEPTFYKQI